MIAGRRGRPAEAASEDAAPDGGVERAVGFLRRHIDSDGALGRAHRLVPDYPNYATALAVLALAKRSDCGGLVRRMTEYLLSQQFTEDNGWTPDHPAYGAWGMGGERRRPPEPGHVDLSMTRYVIQALAASCGAPGNAAVFVDRCRNEDGGYSFSTVVAEANKAGHDGSGWRSYGTATADGALCELALGRDAAAAQRWLRVHHRRDEVPGFDVHVDGRWRRGLLYYYAAASAEAAGISWSRLIRLQGADGSWRNPEPLVKEDDPLIATALALRALLAAA
jgi:hypothetical protein